MHLFQWILGHSEPFPSGYTPYSPSVRTTTPLVTPQTGCAPTLYQVLGLLGHISPGLAFKGEVAVFDFLHDLLSAGVRQTLPLTLERDLAGQHCVLQTNAHTHTH